MDKFKGLFGEKNTKKAPASRPSPIKEVKADAAKSQEKAEVEVLRQKIREKLKKDPKLQKKAAMVLEKMINEKPKK
ncbi:MAG: hypothetical protein K9K67_00545 [Bacteriovoracaceae bacterium]|nr:hypothetical protein [Bacteriovoracaceae bacterium]